VTTASLEQSLKTSHDKKEKKKNIPRQKAGKPKKNSKKRGEKRWSKCAKMTAWEKKEELRSSNMQ